MVWHAGQVYEVSGDEVSIDTQRSEEALVERKAMGEVDGLIKSGGCLRVSMACLVEGIDAVQGILAGSMAESRGHRVTPMCCDDSLSRRASHFCLGEVIQIGIKANGYREVGGLLVGIHRLFSGRNYCLVRRITSGYPWPELEGKRFGMIQERFRSSAWCLRDRMSTPTQMLVEGSDGILAMFFPTRKKSRWGTVFPTGLKRYKEPLVEPKERG
ncbi:hypothetical protein Tco_1156496 [Tanacetum coccineum]